MTGKRGKDKKERNLVSSRDDRIARDSHHHGSSGVPLVHNFILHQWRGSPCCLVTRPFPMCLGKLFPRRWRIPYLPPVPCMCFFLSPGSSRSGRGLVPRHIFHNEVPVLQLPSKLVSGGWFLFGWPTRRFSWAANKIYWPARRSCSKLCNKALRQLS